LFQQKVSPTPESRAARATPHTMSTTDYKIGKKVQNNSIIPEKRTKNLKIPDFQYWFEIAITSLRVIQSH